MIFQDFGKFTNFGTDSVRAVANYLERIMNKTLLDLNNGLKSLKLEENFQSVRLTANVGSTAAVEVRHKLNAKVNSWIVLNGIAGVMVISIPNETGGVYLDRVSMVLDNSVYAAGVTKSVDIILFK